MSNLKFGLALSGGGMKGIAHLGVIKALEEYNIKVDILTGTSSGAIIAGLYSYGLTYQQIYDFFVNVNFSLIDVDYFGILNSLFHLKIPVGLIKGEKILNLLNNITKTINIKDINGKKMAIVATNLINGNDMVFTNDLNFKDFNDKVIINDFLLSEAIRASISFPFIFKPFIRNNYVYVDGGLVDNCPASLCEKLGAEFIVISNMSLIDENLKYDGIGIISQIISILIEEAYEDDIKISNVSSFNLQLNLKSLKIPIITFNKDKLNKAFNFGYETAIEILKQYKFNELK